MPFSPIANAGPDQVAVLGRIVGFDGSESFDPDDPTTVLAYAWRLIRAPGGSVFLYESAAVGQKIGANFNATSVGNNVAVGDMLIIDSIGFEIAGLIPPDDVTLVLPAPDPLPTYTGQFVVVRQGACVGATTPFFAFAPDRQGIYVVQLIVDDGSVPPPSNFSDPDLAAVNVLASSVPLSVPLDMGFLWNYLSDYWEIVQNSDWITGMWAGIARVVGAQLQDLWNVDFDKSLQTTQNVAMRRWLSYHPRLDEAQPSRVLFRNRRAPTWSPVPQTVLTLAGGGTTFQFKIFDEAGPTGFNLVIGAAVTHEEVPALLNAELTTRGYPDIVFTWEAAAGVTTHYYLVGRSGSYVFSVEDTGNVYYPAETFSRFQGISAIQPVPAPPLASSRIVNLDYPPSAFEAWDPDLQIQAGDIIDLGGRSFEIAGVGRRFLAAWPVPYAYLQIELTEDLPAGWVGTPLPWYIPSYFESTSTQWWAQGCTPGDLVFLERRTAGDEAGAPTLVSVECAGARGRKIGTMDPQLFWPAYDYRLSHARRHFYIRTDELNLSAPRLQESVESPPWVMEENLHYVFDERRSGDRYVIPDFRSEPATEMSAATAVRDRSNLTFLPDYLWAEVTHVDNRPVVERNFGRWVNALLDDFDDVDTNYLSVVTGLHYVLTSGPTPANMATAAALIAGYPYAEAEGEILDIVEDFLPGRTYALVRDTAQSTIVRSYVFATTAGLATNPETGVPYAIGDTIRQFALWVQATIYSDHITDSGWWTSLRASGSLTEPEKLHRFAVTLDVDYARVERAAQVLDFIIDLARKTHTYPLLQLLRRLESTIEIEDALSPAVELLLPTWLGPQIPGPMIDVPRLGTGLLIDPNPVVAGDLVLFRLVTPGAEGITVGYRSALAENITIVGLKDITIDFVWGVTDAAGIVTLVNNHLTAKTLVHASLPPGSGAGTIQGEVNPTRMNYRGDVQAVSDAGWLLVPFEGPSRLMEFNNVGITVLSGSLDPASLLGQNVVANAVPGGGGYWTITAWGQFSDGLGPPVTTDVYAFDDWLMFYAPGASPTFKSLGRVVGVEGPSGGFTAFALDVLVDPAFAAPAIGDLFLLYRRCPRGTRMDWMQTWAQDTILGPDLGDNQVVAVNPVAGPPAGVYDIQVAPGRQFMSAAGFTSMIPGWDYLLFFDDLYSVLTYGRLVGIPAMNWARVQLAPDTLPNPPVPLGWFVVLRDPPYTEFPEGPIAPFTSVPFGADVGMLIPGSGVTVT